MEKTIIFHQFPFLFFLCVEFFCLPPFPFDVKTPEEVAESPEGSGE
jgi:hypothetical protein